MNIEPAYRQAGKEQGMKSMTWLYLFRAPAPPKTLNVQFSMVNFQGNTVQPVYVISHEVEY
jgi:hypothetical protein